jgi:phenylalanyl-tRNA synthetase beta chain
MKISLRWLEKYIELIVPVDEMLERLTLSGTEVEQVTCSGVVDPQVVVAQILSSVQHPNADRLRVCQVDDGKGTRQIVCGAKNYRDLDKVPLALPGAKLPGGLAIKESKLRGELSQGMLCSAKELALSDDAEGLLILPADAPVGKAFSEYLPGDTIFELEVTPNRPDLLSYRGLAREMAALELGRLREVPPPSLERLATSSPWSIALLDPDLGPWYNATHLGRVRVGPSPAWLQEAIAATGHRPINNVVDITNFVLFEMGQPLHAFDAAKLQGKILEVSRARAGEKLQALDEQLYELRSDDLVIADGQGPVALAGVMGGLPTGVTEATTEIILETAWFAPATVRRTSRRLNLVSDSSYRYERRVDPGALRAARDRAVQLLQELTGAIVLSEASALHALPASRGPITLRQHKIEGLLGVSIPSEQTDAMLTRLGCEKVSAAAGESIWQPPTYRDDLAREVDLIEEIARLRGLDGVPGRLLTGLQPESSADGIHRRQQRLRRLLSDRGWDECLTDALVEKRFAEGETALQLVNPLNDSYTHLRSSLKPSLLQVAGKNLARGAARLRLFELGKIYEKHNSTTREPMHLGLLIAGLAGEASWNQPERASDYFDLAGVLELLTRHAGVASGDVLEAGPVAPAEARLHGIKTPVYYAEIRLDAATARSPQLERYRSVPAYPPVRRDLAVVVGRDVPQARVVETIGAARAPHLVEVRLFDLFTDATGEKIPQDRKSLAYALTYRSSEKTLTEREVNEAHERVRQKLVSDLACTFRE